MMSNTDQNLFFTRRVSRKKTWYYFLVCNNRIITLKVYHISEFSQELRRKKKWNYIRFIFHSFFLHLHIFFIYISSSILYLYIYDHLEYWDHFVVQVIIFHKKCPESETINQSLVVSQNLARFSFTRSKNAGRAQIKMFRAFFFQSSPAQLTPPICVNLCAIFQSKQQ